MDVPDADFVQWLTTLGVGGVLAAFMFYFYRKDVRQYTDLWKVQSEQLIQVVERTTATVAANSATVAANTTAMQANTLVVRSMHDRLDDLVPRDSRDHYRQNESGQHRRAGNHNDPG